MQTLVLVAPAAVLRTLQAFNDEQRINNPDRTAAGYEKLQNELLRQFRRDIHPDLKFFLIDSEPVHLEQPVLPS